MYNLSSGEKDNSKYLLILETYSTLKNHVKSARTLYNIQQDLFSNAYSEDQYDEIACALSIGDELSVPISYEEAKVLFFALNVNHNNIDSKIRSFTKAYIFYQEFEGNYEIVLFIDTKSSIIHLAKIFYREVVPGITVQYKIPFYVVNNSSGYHFTIAECDRYTMLINDRAYFITRKSFNHLLDNNYAKSFRNHDEVMSSMDISISRLLECLDDADFTKRVVDFPFNSSNCLEVSADTLIYAWDEPTEEPKHWVASNSHKYRLDIFYDNIVALNPVESEMTTYII